MLGDGEEQEIKHRGGIRDAKWRLQGTQTRKGGDGRRNTESAARNEDPWGRSRINGR